MLLSGQVLLRPESRLVRDTALDGIFDRAVVVSLNDFSVGRVEKLSREFLAEKRGGFRLLRLTIGVSEEDVSRSLNHCCIPGARDEFGYYLARLQKEGLPRLPIARLIATRAGALLSYRDARGVVERVIEGRGDPTRFLAGGIDYRMLHFYIPHGAKSGDGLPHVQIYLHAKTISMSSVLLAMKQLEQRLGLAEIGIAARLSPWLLGFDQCPEVPRFEEKLALPNPLRDRFAPMLSCSQVHGEISCSGDRFRP